MALQLGALRAALLDPGNAEKAEKAAEEVAAYQRDLVTLRGRVLWIYGLLLSTNLIILLLQLQLWLRGRP